MDAPQWCCIHSSRFLAPITQQQVSDGLRAAQRRTPLSYYVSGFGSKSRQAPYQDQKDASSSFHTRSLVVAKENENHVPGT